MVSCWYWLVGLTFGFFGTSLAAGEEALVKAEASVPPEDMPPSYTHNRFFMYLLVVKTFANGAASNYHTHLDS